jgi:hypothetical protein
MKSGMIACVFPHLPQMTRYKVIHSIFSPICI